jgi:serine/threonine protein kinase
MSKKNAIPPTSKEYYNIIEKIGKGAFADVYLATHILTGHPVAIKKIKKS